MDKPIFCIGALGGSGTRVLTEILDAMGIFMGTDLNNSLDHLLFTRLFKNPTWYKNKKPSTLELRFDIFYKYLNGQLLNEKELHKLFSISKRNPLFRSKASFYKKTAEDLLSEFVEADCIGWKEPNTQIYLEELLQYIPNLKYIHLLRHGLDMAFSDNTQQLNNWGWKYNIYLKESDSKSDIAVKQLDYWICSTKEVLQKASHFKKRFLLISYETLCLNPETELEKLILFCDRPLEKEVRMRLRNIPKASEGIYRYKNEDISIFREEQLSELRELGFDI